MTASIEPGDRQPGKLKFAMYWAVSCGGCEIALLEIAEQDLELTRTGRRRPLAGASPTSSTSDVEATPTAHIDVCLVQRRHPQHRAGGDRPPAAPQEPGRSSPSAPAPSWAAIPAPGQPRVAPPRSTTLVYRRTRRWTTRRRSCPQERCAAPAGRRSPCPASTTRSAPRPDVVHVDYYMPGLRPRGARDRRRVQAVVTGDAAGRAATLPAGRDNRRRSATSATREKRKATRRSSSAFAHLGDPARAETSACSSRGSSAWARPRGAAAARAARRATCPAAAASARRAGVSDQGAKMLSALASIVDAPRPRRAPRSLGTDPRPDRHVLSLQPGVEPLQAP